MGISYKYGKMSGIRQCQIHRCSRCMDIFFISFHVIDLYRQSSHFNGSQCKIANPHSNAVVDLNGDCLAGV